MSSARKRSALRKAQAENEILKQRLMVVEHSRDTLQAFAEWALKQQQARIDALMLEYCPDEMTHEQLARWEAAQRPVAAEDVPKPA